VSLSLAFLLSSSSVSIFFTTEEEIHDWKMPIFAEKKNKKNRTTFCRSCGGLWRMWPNGSISILGSWPLLGDSLWDKIILSWLTTWRKLVLQTLCA
jgi:hypothetical protein